MDDMEIEVKVPLERTTNPQLQERSAREMFELLEETGWFLDTRVRQRDLYLSHPCRDFSQTDEALRLRSVKDLDDGRVESYVTYKGPKVSGRFKTRYEKEMRIGSGKEMGELLYKLGFEKVLVVEKERTIFYQNGLEAAIDRVSDLGCFLEIEVKDDRGRKGEEMIREVMEDLDLHDTEERSYLELLLSEIGINVSGDDG